MMMHGNTKIKNITIYYATYRENLHRTKPSSPKQTKEKLLSSYTSKIITKKYTASSLKITEAIC